MGDPRTKRDSSKCIWTLQGGEWAQEASVGTTALVPHKVQAKEGSLGPFMVTQSVDWKKKKKHNLKVESYVLFGELLRTEAQDTISQIVLRDCSEEVREESGYIEMFVKNPDS